MPVDCYIGGIEHAVLHLLYSRFFSRALKQGGIVSYDEPFKRLETQGMICHETYKDTEGKWLSPDEIMQDDSSKIVEIKSRKPVTVGRIEKMSKSKKNTVDPRHIIESYGADAARLFMLSDSPPERDLEWTDAGIDGAWRYINRLWNLVGSYNDILKKLGSDSEDEKSNPELLRKFTHKTIADVTQDIERFHFNRAIARIREHTNRLEGVLDNKIMREPKFREAFAEALFATIHLLNPFMPHLAEELWQQLGHKETLMQRPWPKADPALLVDNVVTIAVQINGKLRTTVELPKDMDRALVQEHVLELQTIREALKDKQVDKIIVVPNRIVNVVAR